MSYRLMLLDFESVPSVDEAVAWKHHVVSFDPQENSVRNPRDD